MSKTPQGKLNVFMLAMINVAAICSIKNWPLTAEYGLSSAFYFLIASLLFFIPVSLVSAELATGWPERGGVVVWVKETFGHKMGFLAAWLLWIENIVWYPTVLSFIAGSLAFVISPDLATNKTYLFSVITSTFWMITLVNLLGMKASGWISSFGAVLGTILPGVVIIGLGILWVSEANPSSITFSMEHFLPKISSLKQVSLFAGILLGFAGMEMSAVHAREVDNPQKNFPKAILVSALIIIILSILGTLAIAVVIPQSEINLISSGMEAIAHFLKAYNLQWSVPIFSLLVTIGVLGAISTWTVGPSKGLLAAAQNGDLPPFFHKINKKNMPVGILIFQAVIVTILSALFLLMPDINSSFWLLLVLASQLYLVLYTLMFISALVLRYKRPNVLRSYKIPGGLFGIWAISMIGIITACSTIVIGFFPPDQLDTGNIVFYELFLFIGMIVFIAAPFLILKFKKASWVKSIHYYDNF